MQVGIYSCSPGCIHPTECHNSIESFHIFLSSEQLSYFSPPTNQTCICFQVNWMAQNVNIYICKNIIRTLLTSRWQMEYQLHNNCVYNMYINIDPRSKKNILKKIIHTPRCVIYIYIYRYLYLWGSLPDTVCVLFNLFVFLRAK